MQRIDVEYTWHDNSELLSSRVMILIIIVILMLKFIQENPFKTTGIKEKAFVKKRCVVLNEVKNILVGNWLYCFFEDIY